MSTAPPSLHSLASHCIFAPPASLATKDGQDDDWQIVAAPMEEVLGGQQLSKVVLRDKDVIVAHGKEIRVTSLVGDSWEVNSGRVGNYKVSILDGNIF
jgi:nucleoporin NUP82